MITNVVAAFLMRLAQWYQWRESVHFDRYQRASSRAQRLIRLSDAVSDEAGIAYDEIVQYHGSKAHRSVTVHWSDRTEDFDQ